MNKKTLAIVCIVLLSTVMCATVANVLLHPPSIGRPEEKFAPSIYRSLLQGLQQKNYTIATAAQFVQEHVEGKVAILGHDVDFKIDGVETFRQVETDMDVRSTLYVRLHADYFQQNLAYFQELEEEGFDIGLHYECYSRTGNLSLARELLTAQIQYARMFFNVTTVRGHGDRFNFSLFNREVYEQNRDYFNSMGIYEVTERDTYITDVNQQLQIPPEQEWGDIILVNFHSDYW